MSSWTEDRIYDNQHLLDATEIFRKLNVHKKVWRLLTIMSISERLTMATGIVYQTRLPPRYVLLLSLQYDCSFNQGRCPLTPPWDAQGNVWRASRICGCSIVAQDLGIPCSIFNRINRSASLYRDTRRPDAEEEPRNILGILEDMDASQLLA